MSFVGPFAKLQKATLTFLMYVRPVCRFVRPSPWNQWLPTGRILMKFGISLSYKRISIIFKLDSNSRIITGTIHEDLCTFMITYRSFLHRMRTVLHESCRKYHNTPFVLDKFFPEIRVVCEIMWNNLLQTDRPQLTV
jgi:hypothetical protein